MIPEDGENTIQSMGDMIGSFPDHSKRGDESNDNSVSKEQIENDALLKKSRKSTMQKPKNSVNKLSVIDEREDREMDD